jgi:hypothetical protein
MKRFAILMAVLLVLLAVTPALAITNGQPDDYEHPYVGMMLFPIGGGYYSICSGTLISPTIYLTAAHCVYDAWAGGIQIMISFEEEWSGFSHTVTGMGYPHPDYPGYLTLPATYDVGIVVLDEPLYMDEYGTVAGVNFLDEFTKAIGTKDPFFTSVGFGVNNDLPQHYAWYLARYKGDQRLTNLKNALIRGYNVQLSNNPGLGNGSGGTCSGDSGGPIFYGDTNMVVAVNSFGIAPHCVGTDYAFRVDIQEAQDFIYSFFP